MGRNCMEQISRFDLTPEQWPYGTLRIIVLSTTLRAPPDNLKDRVEIYSGDLTALLGDLDAAGHRHAYVDGGTTIQGFVNLGRLDEITITQMPVLIGAGKPLFGKTLRDVPLRVAHVVACPSDHIQIRYRIETAR